jgi:hypothetical protein
VFEKDEPFCFITLVEYRALDDVTPEIVPLKENPELAAQFNAYQDARKNFIVALDEKDPAAVKQGWQKWYMRGRKPVRRGAESGACLKTQSGRAGRAAQGLSPFDGQNHRRNGVRMTFSAPPGNLDRNRREA